MATSAASPVVVAPVGARGKVVGLLATLPEGVVTYVATGPESLATATELMTEFGLPNGLLPLRDVVECGINKETGFVWITQKKAIVHKFESVSKQVSYGEKITAFLEQGRLKKLTGVKAKEVLWVSVVDISVAEDEQVFFKSFTGLGKSFPAKAFFKAVVADDKNIKAAVADDKNIKAVVADDKKIKAVGAGKKNTEAVVSEDKNAEGKNIKAGIAGDKK